MPRCWSSTAARSASGPSDHFDHHQKYDGACCQARRADDARALRIPLRLRRAAAMPTADPEFDRARRSCSTSTASRSASPARSTASTSAPIGGQTVFNVIDYKSGRQRSLQARAASNPASGCSCRSTSKPPKRSLFDGNATPLAAGYWSMAGGFDAKGALGRRSEGDTGDRWTGHASNGPRAASAQFVDDIRHGDFPVASRDDKCTSHCDFHTVCRIAQIRSLGKTWWPEPTSQPSSVQSRKSAARSLSPAIRNPNARRCTHRRTTRRDRHARRLGRPLRRRRLRQNVRPHRAVPLASRSDAPRRRRAGPAPPAHRHHVHRRRRPRDALPHPQRVLRAAASGQDMPTKQQHWLRLLREIDAARVSTIHAFCTSLLRAHAAEAGLDPTFGVLDQGDADVLQFDVIDDVLREQLAELDDDTLDLAAAYGLRAAQSSKSPRCSATATTRRFTSWLDATPDERGRQLARVARRRSVPATPSREIAAAAPIDELLELLRIVDVQREESQASSKPGPRCWNCCRGCKQPTRSLDERPAIRFASTRESAGRICTAKDWPDRRRTTHIATRAQSFATLIDKHQPKPVRRRRRPRSGPAGPRAAAAHRKSRRRIRRPQNERRASSISTTCSSRPTRCITDPEKRRLCDSSSPTTCGCCWSMSFKTPTSCRSSSCKRLCGAGLRRRPAVLRRRLQAIDLPLPRRGAAEVFRELARRQCTKRAGCR